MKRILVVEDSEVIRDEVADILRMEDFEVAMASNGYEGLVQTKNEKPDLIISDIMMPEMDGYQFVTELKKNPETENIPIIFLSAKSQNEDIRKGMNLGVDDYITKPIHPNDLIAAVEKSFEKQEKLSGAIKRVSLNSMEFLPEELMQSIGDIVSSSKSLMNKEIQLSEEEIMQFVNIIYQQGANINKLTDDYLIYLNLITHSTQSLQKKKDNNTEINSKLYIESIIKEKAIEQQQLDNINFKLQECKLTFNEVFFYKLIEEMFYCAICFSSHNDTISITSKVENDFLVLNIENELKKTKNNNIYDHISIGKNMNSCQKSIEIINLISEYYSGKFNYYFDKDCFKLSFHFPLESESVLCHFE